MATTKPLVEDHVKEYFQVHPEQIHYSKLAFELRRLHGDTGLLFAESVVNKTVNELADQHFLERCARGEFRKSIRQK